jgi:hypothetical protein
MLGSAASASVRLIQRRTAPLPRVVDGDDFHRAANLIHPDFAIADHDALVAGEQIVSLGGRNGGLDLGREDHATQSSFPKLASKVLVSESVKLPLS